MSRNRNYGNTTCKPILFFVFSLLLFQGIGSEHILLLPFIATSHCLEMRPIGTELMNRGHKVTVLLPDFFDSKPCLTGTQFNIIKYPIPVDYSQNFRATFKEVNRAFFQDDRSLTKFFWKIFGMAQGFCTEMLKSIKSMENQLKRESFDVAIVDGIPVCKCLFFIPKFLSIPTISEGSFSEQYLLNIPFQTNVLPSPFFSMTNEMGFTQRFINFLCQSFFRLMIHYFLEPDTSVLSPDLTKYSADQLYKDSLLFLENSDFILDYPKAVFPNFIQTGPLTPSPPKPLNSELEKFISDAHHGVIFISFGSVVESLPQQISEKFQKVAKQVKQKVILIAKSETEIDNLKTVKWVSQNDILGHNKTVLFVSHCGKNSFMETLYHGVPVICFPFNVDAFGTAGKVEHFHVGGQIDIRSASDEEILNLINEVISDDSNCTKNMKRMSKMVRDRPFTAAQTAANAIEHVLKYGSDHMTTPLKHLSFFAYSGGDVWLAVFSFLFFICWLMTKLFLKCVFRNK